MVWLGMDKMSTVFRVVVLLQVEKCDSLEHITG